MKEDDSSKAYEYIMDCVESVIKVQKQRKNLIDKEMLLSSRPQKYGGTNQHNPAALGKEEKGKGTDKDKR